MRKFNDLKYAVSIHPKKSEVALRYLEKLLSTLSPGDKLPSEREIATTLGITRSPVREALIALQMTGRLRVEPAVGAFVTEEKPSSSGPLAISLLAESESPSEVRELRQALEAGIVWR